jgi:ribosomal protein L37AE/L43A
MMSISKIPSKNVKCPTCSKTPNYKRIQNILSDALAYRDSRLYDPEDPIIVSEREVYCCAECYAVSFIREEEHELQEQQSQ